MTIHEQRWSPDTCGCVLLETWDDAGPAEARVHAFAAVEQRCPAHAGTAGAPLYAAVLGENRRKNLVAGIARAIHPAFLDADYTWTFTPERQLLVTIQGFTTAQRTALQAAADLQFGLGLVHVQ